jgi:osmotically-inducible protein OsmY
MKKVFVLPAVGAGLMFFFDPVSGHRRRTLAVDRTLGFVRRRARETARLGRGVAAKAYRVSQKARHRHEESKPQPDDVTLARKVETEIFRDADVPKGQINVNAEDGVVYLRGELEQPDLIRDLEEKARNVQGVREVENLLHTPSGG